MHVRWFRAAVAFGILAMVIGGACSTGAPATSIEAQHAPDDLEAQWQDYLGPNRPLPPENDLQEARRFYESTELPDHSLPQGLVEIKLLTSLCIESMGFPIDDRLDRPTVIKTGMFFHQAGDQVDRFDEVNSACEIALYDLGLLMGTGREANERLYEIYMDSQECLERHGHQTVTPPTKESFIESPGAWYPWEALLPIGEFFTPGSANLGNDKYRPFLDSLEDCPRP